DCGTAIMFGTPLRALKRMRLRFWELPLRLAGFGVGDPEFAHTLAFEFDPVGVVDDAIENGVPHHVDSAHAVSQRRRRSDPGRENIGRGSFGGASRKRHITQPRFTPSTALSAGHKASAP